MSYRRVTLQICLVVLLLKINDVINVAITDHNHLENGHDQAVIHRMTGKHALEHQSLRHSKYLAKHKTSAIKSVLTKLSAVKFLLAVYTKNTKRLITRVGAAEFNLTANDLRTIDQSDTILTFTAQQSQQGGTTDRMGFDISAVPPKVELTSAQLRLYQGANSKNLNNHDDFTIKVYRVLPKKDGEREMQLVDSVNTTAGQEGWITLNVTESMLHWIKHPEDNNGLHLSVDPHDRSSQQTKPEDIGVVGFEGEPEHQPFMVGFFGRNARLIQPTLYDYNSRHGKRDTSNQTVSSMCSVEHHYVSFENLRWHDWIIAPDGYNANYCSGECTYPPYARTDMTYHAIIQGRENQLYPENTRKLCCAPTKLSALNVIYLAGNQTVKLSTWENMAVEACGCN